MELTETELPGSDSSGDDFSEETEIQEYQGEQDQEEGEPRKKARTDLRRPPTTDELISLRQTQNLFHSNLFQLQTTEMLAEVTPTEKQSASLNCWVAELEAWLRALSGRPARPLHAQRWLAKSGLLLPLPDTLPAEPLDEVTFGFAPPANVTAAGALAAGCLERGGTADLLLQMPDSCVQPADIVNARYLRKRALYLTYLAWRLQSCPLVAKVEFSRVDGDPLRPALLVRPAAAGARRHRVRLLPTPPPAALPPTALGPARANVRSKWLLGAPAPPQREPASPRYNSRLLADRVAAELAALLGRRLDALPAGRQALRLLAVWLRQRGLDRGPGAIDAQLLAVFAVWLLERRRLSRLMSAYQVMRNVLVQLTKTDWSTEGVSFVENPTGDQPALQQFTECFDVVLVEPSGFLNLAASVSLATYGRLRDEAERAVAYLDDPEVDSFQALFMTPVPFVEALDHTWHVRTASLLQQTAASRDWPAGGLAAALPPLLTVLRRGLSDRVLLLDVERPPPVSWLPDEPPPAEPAVLTMGLRLNPARLTSLVDKGPDSERRAAAAEFRAFWGAPAGTRRFQDGTIREAVLWTAETLHDKRMVCRQVVLHLLRHHFNVPESDVSYPCAGPELPLCQTRQLPAFPYGSGEEAELAAEAAFGHLSAVLRRLHELPLAVAAVLPAGAALRHAVPFPPLPEMHSALSGRSVRAGASQLLERQKELPLPWAPVCDVIVQLEISGKWPEEPEAIRRVKTAFHLQMRTELTKQSLTAAVRRDGVLVICDGYLFRLCVAYPREAALLRLRKQTEAAARLERDTVQLARLTSALAGLQRQHPAYSASCRLALRWLSAQMLSDLVPEIAAELLMAQVFLSPAPLAEPQQPAGALLRWLRLLARTDWRQQPLLVPLNGEPAPERRAELLARFRAERDRLPAWTVFSPYDETGAAWTQRRPTAAVLHHLQKLAAAAHDLLTSQLTAAPAAAGAEPDWRAIFRPPLEAFDLRIRLRRSRLPRRHQAIDAAGRPARADPYVRQPYEALPAPEFDPAAKLAQELRAAAAGWALVCHDRCGGDVIGVVVRREALRPRPLGTFRAECDAPTTDGAATVVPNLAGFVDLARTLGDGLVDEVEVEADRLAALA